jgi:hypothetical protein
LKIEKHGYFKGQISFLLKFAGIEKYYDDHETCDWSDAENIHFFEQFMNYCKKAATIFGDNGLDKTLFPDFIWEKAPHLVPRLPWTYLQDDFTTFRGWKIYGTPHQPRFFDWAFNLDEPDLERKWSFIPDDTDILLSHGPPHGFGDWVDRDEHVGSPSLAEKIREIRPKLVIYGHIHPGFGVYEMPGITLANVSILNDRYVWTNLPTEFLLDVEKRETTAWIKTIETKNEKRVIKWEEHETTTTKES